MRVVLPLLAVAALTAAPTAAARTRPPALTALRCVPATKASCASGVALPSGKLVQVRGTRLFAGMRVSFRWDAGALKTALKRTSTGWVARIPAGTNPGIVKVTVTDRAGRRSNALRMKVLRSGPTPVKPAPVAGLPSQFGGPGMWIWELPKTEGGDPNAIIARAQATGQRTLFIKAADGTTTWKQFSTALIAQLKAAGLVVCGWQFVYGTDPAGEAQAAVTAIQRGADCFVVDAETRYEGRYAQAQTYMGAVRAAVGAGYPLGLTSFPYVDYHPWLPYSVFLGPGAAQANAPQVYWKDIGTTVDAASAHTFAHNRVYQRPIVPLGQTYQSPSATELRRFRAVWAGYGAGGLSWWDWQETSDAAWQVLAEAAPAAATLDDPGWPLLRKGSKGDEVVWLEEHLAALDPNVPVDGRLSADDVAALQAFQASKGLPASGQTDPATWQSILAIAPVTVDWTTQPAPGSTTARAARAPEIGEHGRAGTDG